MTAIDALLFRFYHPDLIGVSMLNLLQPLSHNVSLPVLPSRRRRRRHWKHP